MRAPDFVRNRAAGFAGTLLFVGTRLTFGALLLATSAYCLLVYTPFSYFGFIRNPLMEWIPAFVRAEPYLLCAVLLASTFTLIADLRAHKTRISAAAFVILNVFFCSYQVVFHRGLSVVSPGMLSYVWSLLAMFPLVWLAAIDVAGSNDGSALETLSRRGSTSPGSYFLAGILIAIAFSGTALIRRSTTGHPVSPTASLSGFAASVGFHLIIFGAFAVVMYGIRVLSDKTPWPYRANLFLVGIFACYLCAQFIRGMILPKISFEGREADLFSVVMSFALVFYAMAITIRLRPRLAKPGATISPHARSWPLAIAALLALCVMAYAIPVVLGPTDWDFVLQECAVIAVWVATAAFLQWHGLRIGVRTPRAGTVAALVVAVGAFGLHGSVQSNQEPSEDWSAVFDEYAGSDISFRTARAILSQPVHDGAYGAFYKFLKVNTNIREDVGPLAFPLVSDLKPSRGDKPNIFLFVVDSLRQDYISAYNPSVDFTPEIGRFAQDSVVFHDAFTRYGGTALSEPAIWTGALQPHKQFIKPLYTMNSLQKLIEADGYQSYISLDPILQEILRPSSSIVELDEGTKVMSDYDYAVTVKGMIPGSMERSRQNTKSWSNLDFVATLSELEAKIQVRADKRKPIFAYTQPQNVHTVNLEHSRLGGSRREISIYELRRIDAAFGGFIHFLEANALYDDSIIILTSDHGDAYGEFGRFGHSDFIFPEVMRIPLIIRLPAKMRRSVVCDPSKIAFSLDITPSLYYLLGHRPTLNSELFGRPLFTENIAEQAPYMRPQYLVASSYAAVYGILGNNGGTLFIADAVNRRNYFYDLTADPDGVHNRLTPRIRDENELLIRGAISRIDSAYGINASR
jgi:sulfatase-like protein